LVGRPIVQNFAGSLIGKKTKKGIFLTTSSFSKEAIQYAVNIDSPKIILIDGQQLVQLMVDYDVGVSEEYSYRIKKIDTDYFIEE